MSLKPQKTSVIMNGSGFQVISKRYNEYLFVSVINPTDNTIEVHEGQITTGEEQNSVITILPYSQLTVPINNVQNFTFIFTDGGAAGTKKADVIFSEDNLMYSGVMGTAVTGDIDITSMPATSIDNAVGLPAKVMVVAGYDGTNVQAIKTDAAGELQIDILTEPATAADNAVGLPAVVKVVGGYDGTNVQAIKTDAAGELQVDVLTLPTLPAGTNTIGKVYESDSFVHIAGATAGTSVKSGAGTLRKVCINTKGTTAVMTIYNNTAASGAVIAVIDLTPNVNTLFFDLDFTIGCFVVITGTLSDVTITYR